MGVCGYLGSLTYATFMPVGVVSQFGLMCLASGFDFVETDVADTASSRASGESLFNSSFVNSICF